jgi:hypothetical protein
MRLQFGGVRLISLFLLMVLAAPQGAKASALHYRLLFDIDQNPATGCAVFVDEVAYVGGPYDGVDYALTLVIAGDVPLPVVTGAFLQSCPGDVLGSPRWTSPGAWAVGIGKGLEGADVIEGRIGVADLGAPESIRVGISAGTPAVSNDVLQTVDGTPSGAPIVFSLVTPVPTLGAPMFCLLAASSALTMFLILRRHSSLRSATLLALTFGIVASGAARAAVMVLDGNVGDWSGVPAVAVDPLSDSLGSSADDIRAAFMQQEGQVIFVRVDVADLSSACSTATDADLDGWNECVDCDDHDGSVFPGAAESCNGVDDDCDFAVDEDFDADSDGFSSCDLEPGRRDCDDTNGLVNPGAAEGCGSGSGNGTDDDCDGFVDEGCSGCDTGDGDGDGQSECEGDCSPNDSSVYGGASEVCDGVDTDCNVFTTENCGVGDLCNWPSNPDICEGDLNCACVFDGSAVCTGTYTCVDFCNTSDTGPAGDGCSATQTCSLSVLYTADLSACFEASSTPGTKLAGAACSAASECRSLDCDRICVGPGCSQKYCLDHCASDAYCPSPSAVCRLFRQGTALRGSCRPTIDPGLGAKAIGDACTNDSECDHGFCGVGTGVCTASCCTDSDCPGNYSCSLGGDLIDTAFVYFEPDPPACTVDSQCDTNLCSTASGKCVHLLTETAGQCVPDIALQGTRPAGASCSANRDCRSQFCDARLEICLETCCSDSNCPTGLKCERQAVETRAATGSEPSRVTNARVCVSVSQGEVWKRK